MTPSLAELRARLPDLTPCDQRRLGRRLQRAASARGPAAREQALTELSGELAAAAARVQARRLAVPAVSYPPELPVSQRKDEIAAAIRDHQVVIIAGETGSGKTTQLPKICLELGRGVTGQIGHTQPRRIAARTVAERIAAELGTELGTAVGYKVRFADTSSDDTLVKVMTDGILLTEMQRDRQLLGYDTLIIDEAHERSLNIDFILGYLRQLLPRRPDLKVIITSATIDPERFSQHFSGGPGQPGSAAPVIEVSGRTYPVEVRYRPLADADDPGREPRDQVQGICDAVAELRAAGPGDILAFLSGEREIRDTADALADQPQLEVLPLYARLPAAEQHKVFAGGETSKHSAGGETSKHGAGGETGKHGAGGETGKHRAGGETGKHGAGGETGKHGAGGETGKHGAPHSRRRVVLATNVAETSLTVPGIKYVIDPGTARISRYSHRTKVQRLPIEAISRASAQQRAGRCGRTSDGICIRLYSEEDFAARPEFTEPEILRTHLASVILRMAALDLGEVADFPFVDPPESRSIADGIRLLEELGALSPGRGPSRLTAVGRKLARLPVDPRLGRMILEAGPSGCVREVLIITAALSIVDPRERPADAREAADAQHRRFAEPGSDFLGFVALWDYLRDQQRELSSSAFRRMCRREYLHYLRVREWQDVYGQLRQAAREVGVAAGRDLGPAEPATDAPGAADQQRPARRPGTEAERPAAAKAGRDGRAGPEGRFAPELAQRVHVCLLAGLLSHIGMLDTEPATGGKRRGPAEFAGARGARFAIFPDSALARKPPTWVMAAELVETSRLWARVAARIEPEWAEPLAGHLVRRGYSDPHWDARRGAVMASEKITLYGLPIVAGRPVNYGNIDPAAARQLFIQHALVEGDWQTHHQFFADNRRLLDEAEDLERRARRRGIVADDVALFDFYDRRIPQDVTSARHFDSWWKKARAAEPGLLTFSTADLVGPAAEQVDPADYPARWGELPLSYEFTPGEPGDGVTVDIPLRKLNQVDGEEFGWLVPGLREELVAELIRSLPKRLRTAFVPAPDTARAVLARLGPVRGDLLVALAGELSRLAAETVSRDSFDQSRLPAHLRMTFRVVEDGSVLAAGRDLAELRRQLRPRLREALNEAASGITRTGLRSWDFGSLPRVFSSGQVRGYPALADAGNAVDIALFETEAEAEQAMRLGTRRLILLGVPSGVRSVASRLPARAKLAMSRHPYPSVSALLDDCAACAADQVIEEEGGPPTDADGFARILQAAQARLGSYTADVVSAAARVLAAAHEAEGTLDRAANPALAAAVADARAQLARLIHPGFIAEAGSRRLPDLVRYLRAITVRLDKTPWDAARDAERMAAVHRVGDAYRQVTGQLPAAARCSPQVQAVPWLIEELRVSLFAQTLGTAVPVSEKRIQAALDRLARP